MNAGGQGGYVQLDRWHPLVFAGRAWPLAPRQPAALSGGWAV